MVALWLGVALAQEASWLRLHEALLTDLVDGDSGRARSGLDGLIRELPATDPAWSEAVYWLGVHQVERGSADEAQATLREGVRLGGDRLRLLALMSAIEIERAALTSLPVFWDFNGEHGLIHPWPHAERASVSVERTEGGAELAWVSDVAVGASDELVIGFASPRPPPTEISFVARSLRMPAALRVTAVDDRGARFGPVEPTFSLDQGERATISVAFRDLLPLDDTPRAFVASRIARVVIQDVTAWLGASGQNEVRIDDVSIR